MLWALCLMPRRCTSRTALLMRLLLLASRPQVTGAACTAPCHMPLMCTPWMSKLRRRSHWFCS
jgi:hypothetical protein